METSARVMAQMRYEHLKSEGICAHCGRAPAEKGRVLCAECLAKQSIRTKNTRKNGVPFEWPAGYFCFICGEPIDEGKLCKKHEHYYDKQAEADPAAVEEDQEPIPE